MLTLAALKMVTVLKIIALMPHHCWKNIVARQSKNGCHTALFFNSENIDD
jgi:hypothetical protein